MPQTLNEAARAVRQHKRALTAAQARKQELETELAAVSAQVAQLEQDEAGIRYSLLEAALGHADEAAQGAASKH